MSSPFYRLATNGVPFVPQLAQHVVQLLVVVLKGGLVLQGAPGPSGGVVHRVFAAHGFLKLLRARRIVTIDGFKWIAADAHGNSGSSQEIFFLWHVQ